MIHELMQFIRYAKTHPQWGVLRNGEVYPLSTTIEGEPTYEHLSNQQYIEKVRRQINANRDNAQPIEDVRTLAPVPSPGKIVCVGLNYHDHAKEQDEPIPDKPLLFGKASTAVTNPDDSIILPEDVDQVDYEVELAVVIGRTTKRVSADEARDYIAGYTVLNDVSARDAQFEDEQFFRGKSYDTFAPIGPVLVSDEEIDPNDLDVTLRVNGDVKQQSTTSEFIFDVETLVEYISHRMTLRPGDVISTGTPGGVGIFRDPPDLLKPGDTVEAEIDSIGTLTNPVESSEQPL